MRVKIGGMCCTTTIGTGKSLGIFGRTAANALGPPVEVPMATISIRRFAGTLTRTAGRGGGKDLGLVEPLLQSALILGMSSTRIVSVATAGLPVLLGLVA